MLDVGGALDAGTVEVIEKRKYMCVKYDAYSNLADGCWM